MTIVSCSRPVFAVLLSSWVLTGCTRSTERAVVVDKKGRDLATREIQRLQKEVNEGSCGAIYQEADTRFRQAEPLDGWLEKCEHIRKRWGKWEKFRANFWQRADSSIVVEGAAGFTKADALLQLVWNMQDERPRMRWLSLQIESENIIAPAIPPPLRSDPPMLRNQPPV